MDPAITAALNLLSAAGYTVTAPTAAPAAPVSSAPPVSAPVASTTLPTAPTTTASVIAAVAPGIASAVAANPNVPNTPEAKASVVGDVLNVFDQALPGILALSRADPRTSAEVSLGVAVIEALSKLF